MIKPPALTLLTGEVSSESCFDDLPTIGSAIEFAAAVVGAGADDDKTFSVVDKVSTKVPVAAGGEWVEGIPVS